MSGPVPSFAKLLPGIGAGFVSAFGLWSVLTKDADTKLPHTVRNPDWEKATIASFAAFPRHASEIPVQMNPSRVM